MANLLEEANIIISANGSDDGSINGLKPSTATFVDIPYTRGSSATKTNEQKVIVPSEGANVPRLDFSGGEAKWLVERQSTNLIANSDGFGGFTPNSSSVSSVEKLNPFGDTDNVILFNEGSDNNRHRFLSSFSWDEPFTQSFFVKKKDDDWIQLLSGANENEFANFNLLTGVVGRKSDNADARITPAYNGWFRVSIKINPTSPDNRFGDTLVSINNDGTEGRYPPYQGTNRDNFYLYRPQRELGNLTSIIPTNGSTVTRLKDNPESVAIASTVTGAVVRDNYIQNYAGNTPSLLTMKSNTNRIITYGRQLVASEITCGGLTKAVFMLDIKATKEFQITVSGTGVVYWGDGESDSYDGTEVVLTHTFVKVGSIVAFVGTLTFWKSITADVNYFHSLSSLPINITSYENIAANESYGSINDLPSTIIYYENRGLNQVNSYTSGKVFSSDIVKFIHLPIINFGLTSAMVDNLLNDLESSGMSSGIITLNGQNEARTAASDAAVTSMENKGVVVNTN